MRRDGKLAAAGLAVGLGILLLAGGAAAAPGAPEGGDGSAGATVAAADSLPADPTALAARIGNLIRAGRLAEALAAVRRYRGLDPDEPVMAYNEACLEARLGRPEAAMAALREAFALGFGRPEVAAQDPDLASLRGRLDFEGLLAEQRQAAAERARRAALVLDEGHWGARLPLRDSLTGEAPAAAPTVRLRFDAEGWQLEAAIPGPEAGVAAVGTPPWRGGAGLRVDVVPPAAADSVAGGHAFSFVFGRDGKAPAGAVLALAGRPLTQPVAELAPEIVTGDGGGAETWRLRIPWSSQAPYAPPADTLLGMNVFWTDGERAGRDRWLSLIRDPSPRPGAAERRFVPVTLRPTAGAAPLLAGKVPDAVVGPAPLAVEVAAWLPAPAAGDLRLALTDPAGRGRIAGGELSGPVPAQGRRPSWTRRIDMAALPAGPYRLDVTLALPADTLAWSTPLLRYDPDWLAGARQRLEQVPDLERPTVRLRLDAVAAAMAERAPRADPSPIATTVLEADRMLDRAARGASVLPDSGVVTAAYPAPGSPPRPCVLALPAGGDDRGEVLLVLSGPLSPDHLAAAAGRALAGATATPTVVVLQRQTRRGGTAKAEAADVAAAAAWAAALFGDPEPSLVEVAPGGDGLDLTLPDATPNGLAAALTAKGVRAAGPRAGVAGGSPPDVPAAAAAIAAWYEGSRR